MQFCMDWNAAKFDWNRARAFLVTAEEGSLSAAARALGLAQPTLLESLCCVCLLSGEHLLTIVRCAYDVRVVLQYV